MADVLFTVRPEELWLKLKKANMEMWVFCSFRVKYVPITGACSYYFWEV